MDSYEFRVEANPPYTRYINGGIKSAFGDTSIQKQLHRINAKYGPSNTSGGLVGAGESVNVGGGWYFYMGCRYKSDEPLDHQPARNIEWDLCGSQLGWDTWDMTSRTTFKVELIDLYTSMFNNPALEGHFQQLFGEGYQDLDYNIILYWGYPTYEDGSPYGELVTFECIYIGNTPLYDELITP